MISYNIQKIRQTMIKTNVSFLFLAICFFLVGFRYLLGDVSFAPTTQLPLVAKGIISVHSSVGDTLTPHELAYQKQQAAKLEHQEPESHKHAVQGRLFLLGTIVGLFLGVPSGGFGFAVALVFLVLST
jgi:hypothetical protein